jgi:hypothetical protein
MEGNVKKQLVKKKFFTILSISLLLFTFLTNGLTFLIPIVKTAYAVDIQSHTDSNSSMTVSVLIPEPRINWYDLQNEGGSSMLNAQIDVNQQYRFIINISSDQGWADIDYINITAWYDNGSEITTYNQTQGGNLNIWLQYENTTGTAVWRMLWPDDEATFNNSNCTDVNSSDPYGSPGKTECHNLTFLFTPGYQFRYAPGVSNSTAGYNDLWSWNFNITIEDTSGNKGYEINEFGVYSYSEVVVAGMVNLSGNPGYNATGSTITVTTRSNGNFSLYSDVDDLLHTTHPTANMSNTTVWVRGGDLGNFTNFNGSAPIYLYGNSTSYVTAENDNTSKLTNNVEYRCTIPFPQLAGDYNATIYYHLKTQTF